MKLVCKSKTISGKTVEENKESVISALVEIAIRDMHFNGKNGFVSPTAKSAGFENNLDYAFSEAFKKSTPLDALKFFLEFWLGSDGYYQDYSFDFDFDIDFDNNGAFITSIAIAYITD